MRESLLDTRQLEQASKPSGGNISVMITLSDEREQLECQIVLDETYFLQEYDTLKRRYYLEVVWI